MTVPTLTLADFLLARIAEDEVVARSVQPVNPKSDSDLFTSLSDPTGTVEMAPARALAECETKRRIVGHHGSNGDDWPLCVICTEVGPDAQGWPCLTLRLLALAYADHPDCRDEWRP